MMKKKIINGLFLFYIISCPQIASPQNILQQLERELTQLVEKTKPSVVTISSKSSQSYIIQKENGFMSLFKNSSEKKTVCYNSICSGLIYNEDGYIITKSNRLNEFEEINVILYDGSEHQPTYIGRDPETGITVLKIETDSLFSCKVRKTKGLKIGSWVTVIGNSMGISPSVSFGVVTGFYENGLLQISAIVSPGNSGSPVFNIRGEVVGILAAQIETEKAIGVNKLFTEAGIVFPIDKTCAIVDTIIKSYMEHAGWLGVELESDSLAAKSIVINNVLHDSPAKKAGLKKGDILIQYNNTPLINPNQLGSLIKNTKPGSMVVISFKRDNTPLSTLARVGRRGPFPGEQ